MKVRRITLAFLTLLSSIAISTAVPSPAAAHTAACSGNGVLHVDTGLWYVALGPAKAANFTLTVACPGGPAWTMSGSLVGNCEQASGGGSSNGHHPHAVVIAGNTLTFSNFAGTVSGSALIAVDPLVPNNSCLNGTASRFLVTGFVGTIV